VWSARRIVHLRQHAPGGDPPPLASAPGLDAHGAETLRSAPHTTEEEETIMFGNVIAAVKNAIVGWARAAVKAVGR